MRVEGWERRLKLAVEKHIRLPAEYGVSDCLIIALDGIEAVTGEDPYPRATFDRVYSTAQGALRCLKQAGFDTVGDVLRAKFPEVAPSLAQRGDVGLCEHDGQLVAGLFTQLGFMTRGTRAVVFLPASAVTKAFKVG